MAVDTFARGMAAKAVGEAESIVSSFTSGFAFKGVVDYVDDLPASGNTNGDMYLVRYNGSSGTSPLNVRYAWGDDDGTDAWIPLSAAPYSLTFNETTDWTASGSDYVISVLESVHQHGADATIQVRQSDGNGGYTYGVGNPTDGYTISVNSDGDITLTASSTGRFAGKLVVM